MVNGHGHIRPGSVPHQLSYFIGFKLAQAFHFFEAQAATYRHLAFCARVTSNSPFAI